ncbi:hypothetical protein Daesc_007440 [Daldinia eschscholtzii]|uniref:Zn(2)-C6 fungal-type domain-containing protein n=1 Tax=Daldinia eschscholtzii TaxID=292717 RepID=A0AAX6MFG6_9PEZI
MSHATTRSLSGGEPGAKRRKVRKGTHSCWECRRRKTRCQYASATAAVCKGCEVRGTTCVSQEFPDVRPPASDRGLSQRLSNVEVLLEKLVEQTASHSYTPDQMGEPFTSSVSAEDELDSSPHMLRPSAAGQPPVVGMFDALREDNVYGASIQSSPIPTPALAQDEIIPSVPAKYAQVSRILHAAFPCQHDINVIIQAAGPGAGFIVAFLNGRNETTEPPSAISEVPPPSSHPALLAKRLMQLTLCMQRMPIRKYPKNLISKEPIRAQMARFVNLTSDLVTSQDDLVGSCEGLTALTLMSLYHANAGNLRKSWLTLRRVIAVTQLMGADRWPNDKRLKSVDPKSDPATRLRGSTLWYRINFNDRFLSLLLGLPAASEDNSFATPERMDGDIPTHKLSKLHTVISGAIIKRNANSNGKGAAAANASSGITHDIDRSLEAAAKSMSPDWWLPVDPPDTATASAQELLDAHMHVMMQMNHNHLLILIHLPYFIRDPKERRWDYSKTTCLQASRKVLEAYLVFRHLTDAAGACRHTDYGALTASMTLLLGYLDPKLRSRDPETSRRREADRKLALSIRDVMHEIAEREDDKMSRETSDIITRLLPLMDIDLMAKSPDSFNAPVRLEIPYLGTININPVSRRVQQDRPHVHPDDPSTAPAPVHYSDGRYAERDRLQSSSAAEHAYTNGSTPVDPGLQPRPEASSSFLNMLGEDANFSLVQFEPADASAPYPLPGLAAEMNEWPFQGFDANFFESLFSS